MSEILGRLESRHPSGTLTTVYDALGKIIITKEERADIVAEIRRLEGERDRLAANIEHVENHRDEAERGAQTWLENYCEKDAEATRYREALDYGVLASDLYDELAALPDGNGNPNSFLPACVCCDLVGVHRFKQTLARILRAILSESEVDDDKT
jgi:hypothetical protein